MSVLPLVIWPDARLTATCAPVAEITPEIEILAADMLETMYAALGRGLAAPQVGELVRMFVMDIGWKEGFGAACVQHELDHLDGIVTFDHQSAEARAELLALYAQAGEVSDAAASPQALS